MPDGLEALENRRKARNIPPSRHKPRATPVPVQTPDATKAEAGSPVEPSSSGVPEAAVQPPRKRAPKPAAGAKPAPDAKPAAPVERLAKHTIHLGPAEDEFLEDVFLAGRRKRGGRVDANRSAVVRLALRRLAAEQTPDQIVETIRTGTTKQVTGRPRF